MGLLCRELDWSHTLLGPLECWPAALRAAASLVLAAPQPMLLLWGPQLVQFYNDGFRALLGARHPATLGRRACEGWPQLWKFSLPIYRSVLEEGESFVRDEQPLALERDGSRQQAFFNLAYSAVRDELGEVVGILLCAQDVTAARRAREETDLQRRRLHAALELLPVGVWIADDQGQILYANPSTRAVWGGPAPLLDDPQQYQQVYRGWWPDGRPLADGEWGLARAVQRGESSGPEVVHIAAFDGTRRVLENYGTPILDRHGQVAGAVAVSRDITAAHRAEVALRQSEEKYRSLFESLDDGFAILQMLYDVHGAPVDYRFLEVNASFARHTGLEGVRGRRIRELWPNLDPFWPQTYGRVAESGEPVRFTHHSDLVGRWFEVYAFRVGAAEQRQVAALFADITERREAEAAQEQAARRKDEFLAMLGHELRNPLAAISNTLWLLQRRVEEPFARHYLEIIERQSRLLRGMVDDLLDVSRITRGLVQIRHEPVELGAVVRRALEGVQGLMSSLHHQLLIDLPQQPLHVSGDAVRLEQVLNNLLTNAAKYTDPGGQIEVTLAAAGAWIELGVRDNGIGMSDEVLARAFELFAQAERGLDRAQGGLGIGLTVVRRLVELHGGSVHGESAGLGRGAFFLVRLPRLQRVPEAAPAPSVEPGIHAPRKVLVVDDSVEIATTLAHVLEQAGHTVSIAHQGERALGLAQNECPEVVLLDIGLPGLSGYEVAARLRGHPATRDALLVALTGYGQAADRVRALQAGFDAHFVKPVDIDALEAFVARTRRA